MKLSEAMTRDVRVANPDQSIREAAQLTKTRRLSARRSRHLESNQRSFRGTTLSGRLGGCDALAGPLLHCVR
jgi:hypothetical protein